MTFIIVLVLLVAAVVGGFLFAKNNPKKSQIITDSATKVVDEVKTKIDEIKK
jgi:hypothetical protein